MTGLHPDTSYSYTIDGSGSNFTFTSQPSVGSSFNFIAFGDMGVDSKSKESEKCKGAVGTLSSLKDEISKHRSSRPDFIMHAGDLSYANGHPGVWDEFMDFIEPVASRVPYMVAIGNHEYDYDHGTNRDPSGAAPYHPDWGNYGYVTVSLLLLPALLLHALPLPPQPHKHHRDRRWHHRC